MKPALPDRIRLPFHFDPARMQADLAKLADIEWIDHFVKQNYRGNWSVIPLRGPAGAEHPVMMIYSDPTCDDFADCPWLGQCPYFGEILAKLQCPVQAVRLMRLTPGSAILEHTDYDLAHEQGMARLHIPVRSNPDTEFYLNDIPIRLAEGECWYLRLADPHRAANNGSEDRVHLVIDAVVNEWLTALLAG